MKTIKTLKINGEDCNIRVLLQFDEDVDSGVSLKVDSSIFTSGNNNKLSLLLNPLMFENGGIDRGLTLKGVKNANGEFNYVAPITYNNYLSSLGTCIGIGLAPEGGLKYEENVGLRVISKGATNVTWDANSNMNNFKTPGVYEIYGERTRQDDNLPILNASSGHSIAARLIVVASTLQPANNEICITQFLMLSNRQGGDGNMYIRTYNENNSPFADWWTPWQKMQGVKEGYIFTNTAQINPDGGVQQIEGVTGLDNMIDNGIYAGIYTDDPTFQAPTFIDTFTLIVINNYAVAGKDSRLKRTISQLKYAVDAITNQATVKQRTKTDGDTAWSDWEDIGGGTQEVDITDAVKAYGLPTLVAQGFAKEGVTYVINIPTEDISNKRIKLDTKNKLAELFAAKFIHYGVIKIKFTYDNLGYSGNAVNGVFCSDWGEVDFCIIFAGNSERVLVSADMTEL